MCIFLTSVQVTLITIVISMSAEEDWLIPYSGHHGPVRRRLRDTRQCQHHRYGNTTYSLHRVHSNLSTLEHVFDRHHKLAVVGQFYYSQRIVTLRYERVYNPLLTVSVLEPGHAGSCRGSVDSRATVQHTALSRSCLLSANAGFFNTQTGDCLGNVISDGHLVKDSGGIQNVHFGITKQGMLFTGYLSEIELVTFEFQQLVGGVIWLVKDGEVYVDESRNIECPDTQETGTLDRFIGVVSARTAVGHDALGRVLMVQVDGKTDRQGVNLREFAGLLKELGFVNAINLDGGGSATSVINGTLVNYPSDACVNSSLSFNCARKVSTILCVHRVECRPSRDCSHHGRCVAGQCQCQSPWSGESCSVLSCPDNCGEHGTCTADGCVCDKGWRGGNCSQSCAPGFYGSNCSSKCVCHNNAECEPVDGRCLCPPGFTGETCHTTCAYGFYGDGCLNQCWCPQQCFCHPVTGACSNGSENWNYLAAGRCLTQLRIATERLVPDQSHEIWVWQVLAVAAVFVASASVAINVWLAILVKRGRRTTSPKTRNRRYSTSLRNLLSSKRAWEKNNFELTPLQFSRASSFSTDSSDNTEDEKHVSFKETFPLKFSSDSR